MTRRLPALGEVERAAGNGTLPDLIGDLRGGAAAGWLARALRADLAALVAAPTLALQSVWAHGWFVRDEHGDHPLRTLLRRWRSEHGDRPWARALRHPPYPLWSALDEEYRGDFAAADGMALTEEAIVVRRGGAPWLRLDRRDGTRTALPASAVSAAAGWMLALDVPPDEDRGRCRVVDRATGAVVVDVRPGGDDAYTCLAAATDGTVVFAGGWFCDYDGVVLALDVPAGTVRWRWTDVASVGRLTCADDGSWVVVSAGGRLTVLDGATGEVRHRGRIDASHGALDPAGARLAILTPTAVRVFALDRLGDVAGVGIRGSDAGLAYALWSPDGRRLLTGSALCDGVDGRLVKVLRMDRGGYLEGGPPPGARAVGDTVVVEFGPTYGTRVWDARTGARLVDDPRRRYSLGADRLWIAPDALTYVHAPRYARAGRGESICLIGTLDGSTLARLDGGQVTAVTWHPDGGFSATSPGGEVRHWDAAGRPCEARAPEAPAGPGFWQRAEDGYTVLAPAGAGTPVHRIAADGELVPDPTGRRWASPTAHVVLEPGG